MTMRFYFFFLFSVMIWGQEIVAPLDIPLKLSGTFGEFRPTHFHAGLDIKTQGKEGFEVRAIQAGSIRRIKVSTSGYGKCLYIQHQDGTTSVYAHLKKFAPKIETYIKAQQYDKEEFTIQQFLKLGEMKVEAGEVIGLSGNTGGSMGPHLHFEIRDTQAETPLNPLSYGLDIPDSIRPIVQELYRYPVGRDGAKEKKAIPFQRKNDSTYVAEIQHWGGLNGLGIRLFDRQDQSYNRNGVYNAQLYVNGSQHFGYTFDRIDFSDGKKIDALIDYATYKDERKRVQKLFRDVNVNYSFLPSEVPNGLIDFENGKSYQVRVILEDFAKNRTQILFYVEGKEEIIEENQIEGNRIIPDKDYLYVYENQEVYIPKDCFYAPTYLNFVATKDTLKITSNGKAQRKGFELQFRFPSTLDSIEKKQLCLAQYKPKARKKNQRLRYIWTVKKDSSLRTKNAYPGTYVLVKDSLPPTIVPLNFKDQQWMSNYKFLQLELKDDFSGVAKYSGNINGQWILLEHEPKDHTLTYDFSDIEFKETELTIEVIAEDGVGNTQVFTHTIFRKPKKQ